ncbi:hypothetical protein SNEBB_002038 [Seison nebaliae]|nr:hypothetical protein SNEBB_002038 [Seison nebaliae]
MRFLILTLCLVATSCIEESQTDTRLSLKDYFNKIHEKVKNIYPLFGRREIVDEDYINKDKLKKLFNLLGNAFKGIADNKPIAALGKRQLNDEEYFSLKKILHKVGNVVKGIAVNEALAALGKRDLSDEEYFSLKKILHKVGDAVKGIAVNEAIAALGKRDADLNNVLKQLADQGREIMFTDKGRKFISTIIGDKYVSELPGIGKIYGERLCIYGFEKASNVLGQNGFTTYAVPKMIMQINVMML